MKRAVLITLDGTMTAPPGLHRYHGTRVWVGQGPDGVLFACPGYAGTEHPRGWRLAGIEVNRDKWELDGIQIPEDSTQRSSRASESLDGGWKCHRAPMRLRAVVTSEESSYAE